MCKFKHNAFNTTSVRELFFLMYICFFECVQVCVFFARVARLLDEGVQVDLLFCLLSGHSSEHWPSPKLKPLVSDWSQRSADSMGRC